MKQAYSVWAVLACAFLALLLIFEAWLASQLLTEAEAAEIRQKAVVVKQEAEQPEDYENEKIEEALLERSTRLDDVTVTHYCTCAKCCGWSTGITASGVQATPYVTVAVDPDVIPLGSDVLVDYGDGEIHYYRADDTGGAVKGSHIDLCVSSHQEALELGVRTATVWWVTP